MDDQKTEVRGQKSEVGCRMTDVRGQRITITDFGMRIADCEDGIQRVLNSEVGPVVVR
jgi:hypothetical protein